MSVAVTEYYRLNDVEHRCTGARDSGVCKAPDHGTGMGRRPLCCILARLRASHDGPNVVARISITLYRKSFMPARAPTILTPPILITSPELRHHKPLKDESEKSISNSNSCRTRSNGSLGSRTGTQASSFSSLTSLSKGYSLLCMSTTFCSNRPSWHRHELHVTAARF